MVRRIVITTGARLHFGPLAVHALEGRSFGGVGLMIDAPATEVAIERAERDEVRGDDARGRAADVLLRCRRGSAVPPPACRLDVVRAGAAHTGLGSGTQLALTVAKGLSLIDGEPDLAPAELARRAGRGDRSAIGTYGFLHGGFLVDAGIASPPLMISEQVARGSFAGGLGDLAARETCPEAWRFLLVAPPAEGLSGSAEQQAFVSLFPMRKKVTGELCRIVLMEWLPAVRCADFPSFCRALDEYGRRVGTYFERVQGGVYAHPRMAALAAELHASGIHGIAQSSWGPTIVICCANDAAAARLHAHLSSTQKWSDCSFRVVTPLNAGARIVVES